MAFFTSPEQEVYEHRLKRSTSLTSVRARSRQASGPPMSPPPSRIHTQSRQLTLASDHTKPPRLPSPTPSPILTAVLAASNQPDLDLRLSPKLPSGPVLRHDGSPHRDDPGPLQAPPRVHDRPPQPEMPSPSLPRRDFDFGSLSDSGVTSRIPPRRFNLSSPLPPLSLLHARHHSPSSPNLPIAGYFSDGDRSSNLLHPSRLDVKRLLSKPAAPSVNSTLSITSDSEPNALPRAQRSNAAWPSKTRMQVHFQPSSTPPAETTEPVPTSPQPSIQQRPRNLLRKRSASKQNRATVSATLPGKTTTPSALQPTIRSPPASLRTSAPVSHGSSSKLTPAGAIAQAYKEQDLRREALAAAARAETVVTASGSRLGVPDPPTPSASVTSTVGNGLPYYTVFGSSSDRIVIVGSVADKSYDTASGSNSASTASASQPIKSLTRKVSARFRRGRPSLSKDGGSPSAHGDGGGGEHEHLNEDLSGHERQRSTSYPKVKNKFGPLRLSLDQRKGSAPTGVLEESLEGRSPLPVSRESTPDVVVSSPVQSKGKQKMREDDISAGGRLWRLVKRISAGGLRERFNTATTGEPVPPVPTIPPDLLPSPATLELKMPITPNSACGLGGAESGDAHDCLGTRVGCSVDSPPSTSTVRPNADSRPSMTCGIPSEIPSTPQGPGAVPQSRLPSISSSSPQSSEPMSTHFFRSHSSRSSFSSMFCGSPPQPPVSAPVQTSSPRTRTRTKSSASSLAPTRPSHDGLPQSSKSPRARSRKRSSPDMPAFSVSDVINNFIVRRPSLVRRASSSRRQQQQHQNSSAQSINTPCPEESSTPPLCPPRSELRNADGQDERIHPVQSPGPSVQSHDSHSSSSTERAGSASASTISARAGASPSPGSVAQVTFRELGGTRRQAWTSQEKEDKWDDLLEKSARAGGTLHLGAEGGGLASDNIRFSSSTLGLERTEI